ncbi:Hypothetical protein A7982_13121 [Minicystis rosea]|nr:Hypothetical protein A7982_13121 [Minicystis rosea]
MSQPSQETTYFSDDRVTITSTRAMFDGTMYPLRNITSVRAWTVKKRVLPLVLGILFCFFALPMFGAGVGLGGTVLLLGIGLICLHVFSRDWHYVRIGTAGGETDAVASKDGAYISLVVFKLNDAIVNRG